MPKLFFIRLYEYYRQIGKVLQGEAETASIFPNPTDKGLTREQVYMKFLTEHLPIGCKVLQGGYLFNLGGHESKQLDLIIISDSSLQFNFFSKSFACIEGTLAVVAIKSNLTSSELEKELINFSSIPDKEPLTDDRKSGGVIIRGYDNWPYKVIYATDGATIPSLKDMLDHFYVKNPNIPMNKRPDLIHVAGKGSIIMVGSEGGKTRDGTEIKPNTYHSQPTNNDVFALTHVQYQIQKNVMASRHIFFNYDKVMNTIPLSDNYEKDTRGEI